MTDTPEPASDVAMAAPRTDLRRASGELRRAALSILVPDTFAAEREWALAWMNAQPAMQVAHALVTDQVDQLFLHAAKANDLTTRLPDRLVDLLSTRKLQVAAGVMRQDHALGETCSRLEDTGVEHVVFKGALVRSILYAERFLRPSVDVDLLVDPGKAPKVARALEQLGYKLARQARTDTHEVSLTKHRVEIDLHWHLLRPGRMREDITCEIIEGRVRRGDLWAPNDTHLTVAMLVHPAITDYVTGSFINAVDLDLWLRKCEVRWDEVIALLRRIGLGTAAWAMLAWTHGLFGTPVPSEVWRALDPGALRKRYLEAWLAHHPARLYLRQPWLVRGAFSLALQDRPRDVARALWQLARKDRLPLDHV